MEANTTTALEVSKLTIRFGGVIAINDLDLDVKARTVHAIIGPNGAGKTTLLNGISGLVRPLSGSVRIRGVEVLGRPATARIALGLGRTFQHPTLVNGLTALENVQLGLYSKSKSTWIEDIVRDRRARSAEKADVGRALAALAGLGVDVDPGSSVAALSLGTRKLIDIARALVADPDVLLMDEPTSGLDRAEVKRVEGVLKNQRGNRTIIVIAHHLDFVMNVADVVTVLNFGARIAEGSPEQVKADPRVIETYIGARS
ncbi:MAG: ABC transporter ATP-binding protein [Streptosporangiaceae bacterium]